MRRSSGYSRVPRREGRIERYWPFGVAAHPANRNRLAPGPLIAPLLLLMVGVCGSSALAEGVSDMQAYARASEHRAAGRLDEAMTVARGITDPVLAEAAAVLIGDCMVAQRDFEAADALYRDALADTEFLGLYRGELLIGRAIKVCFVQSDRPGLQEASEWIAEAMDWCRQMSQDAEREQLRQRAAKLTGPTILASTPLHRSSRTAVPGLVVNPLTAPWYIEHLESKLKLLNLYVRSQLDGVSMTEAEAVRLDGYRAWQDAQDGAFLIEPEAWDQLSGEHFRGRGRGRGASLRFGLFLIASGRHDMAAGLFDPIYAEANAGGLDSTAWAVSALGAGVCALRLGDPKRGITILDRFNDEFRQTPVTPLARFVLANHLAGSSSKKTRDRAYRLYGDIASQHADSPYAAKALLAMGVAAANHNDGAMIHEAQRLLRDHDAPELYIRLAESLVAVATVDPHTDQPPPPRRRRPGEPAPVGLRIVRDRLSLPAATHPQTTSDAVMAATADTVLRCHLFYGSHAGAYTVEAYHAVLSELEPQPPAGREGRTSFYRLPTLWVAAERGDR